MSYNTSTGAVSAQRYTPYGVPRGPASTLPTDYRFTGQRSEEAGLGSLYDYNARFYSPALGRFLSPDTLVPSPGNPSHGDFLRSQSLNRYAYGLNNPVKYRDPSGDIPIDWLLDVGGIAFDIYQIIREPSRENWQTLAVDVGLWAVPYTPAIAGIALRSGKTAAQLAAHADEAADLARLAGHMGDGTHAVLSASMLLKAGAGSPEASTLVKALARQGTKGELVQGSIVSLGHFGQALGKPGYIDWAKEVGAVYLDLDQSAYGMLQSAGKWWDINQQFLDDAIAAGASFHLQLPQAMKAGSYFQKEIDYLIGKGYRLIEENGEFWLRLP